ncbi:hypothetical protein ACFE04_026794 [Oxalis oulophora]
MIVFQETAMCVNLEVKHAGKPQTATTTMPAEEKGNKSSSSPTNASGSSTLSPNTDGGGGQPSHLSGHPSSVGGTRPSTDGSDRSHEPNAWGSNLWPSSPSGTLAINRTSAKTLDLQLIKKIVVATTLQV